MTQKHLFPAIELDECQCGTSHFRGGCECNGAEGVKDWNLENKPIFKG
jgi:hypothetical protein